MTKSNVKDQVNSTTGTALGCGRWNSKALPDKTTRMDASYEFLRAARALLGMTNVDLAAKAGVSKRSLVRIEAGETVRPEIRRRVQAVFEEAGIVFVPEDSTSGPGLRVRNDLPESAARDSDRSAARRSLGEAKIIQASDIPATR